MLIGAGTVQQRIAPTGESAFLTTVHAATKVSKNFTGWKKVNGKILFYNKGKKATGLYKVRGKLYLFKKGASKKGWQKIGSKKYYFKKAAKGKYALVKSKKTNFLVKLKVRKWVLIKEATISPNGYYQDDAVYGYKRTTSIFYFNKAGKMAKGTNANGHVLKTGGKLYYLSANGIVNPRKKVLGFKKFTDGAWIRVLKYGGGTTSLTCFGAKEVDSEALAKLNEIISAVDSDAAVTAEQYSEIFRYNWLIRSDEVGYVSSIASRYVEDVLKLEYTHRLLTGRKDSEIKLYL
jgi:hypothetical protein